MATYANLTCATAADCSSHSDRLVCTAHGVCGCPWREQPAKNPYPNQRVIPEEELRVLVERAGRVNAERRERAKIEREARLAEVDAATAEGAQ